MAESAGPSKPAVPTAGDQFDYGVMNVAKEDQLKINRFAKLNARLEDIKDDMISKSRECRNLEDALSEAEVKVLEDEGDKLYLQVGDIMVNLEPEKTQKWLEDKIAILRSSVRELVIKRDNITGEMMELKAHLYARFGNNIHLESGP